LINRYKKFALLSKILLQCCNTMHQRSKKCSGVPGVREEKRPSDCENRDTLSRPPAAVVTFFGNDHQLAGVSNCPLPFLLYRLDVDLAGLLLDCTIACANPLKKRAFRTLVAFLAVGIAVAHAKQRAGP